MQRKENAYVFDFDPAGTLTIFEQFANNLNPSTAKGRRYRRGTQGECKGIAQFLPSDR